MCCESTSFETDQVNMKLLLSGTAEVNSEIGIASVLFFIAAVTSFCFWSCAELCDNWLELTAWLSITHSVGHAVILSQLSRSSAHAHKQNDVTAAMKNNTPCTCLPTQTDVRLMVTSYTTQVHTRLLFDGISGDNNYEIRYANGAYTRRLLFVLPTSIMNEDHAMNMPAWHSWLNVEPCSVASGPLRDLSWGPAR